ncbi:MAG: glycosyltransferase family 4 protein [Clostridiales bacterium]|nr:glycosyltransferase family 4 protein [Clostridiales bacterium]MCF8022791.1 glycosyltransferase family 4 protein [Clostridiales bacterium]
MNSKKKCLVIYRTNMSFVKNDIKILQQKYIVKKFQFRNIIDCFKLLREVYITDFSFVWFANIWSVLAIIYSKFFKKKVVVVAGGYDAAFEPQIEYGLMCHFPLKYAAKFSFKHADKILAVSEYTKNELINNVGELNNVELVYNGVDHSEFKCLADKKENVVVTIGAVKKGNLQKKGLKLFVESAKYLPQINFLLIGPYIDDSINELKAIASENVFFIGYVPHEQIVEYLNVAKVYVQASVHESFGVAVAEAMLCKCIPVVANKGALPEVVGNNGVYLYSFMAKELADKINQALNGSTNSEGRKWIMNNYLLEYRSTKLKKSLERIT